MDSKQAQVAQTEGESEACNIFSVFNQQQKDIGERDGLKNDDGKSRQFLQKEKGDEEVQKQKPQRPTFYSVFKREVKKELESIDPFQGERAINKRVVQLYKELSQEDKAKYTEMFNKEKLQYAVDYKEWENIQGNKPQIKKAGLSVQKRKKSSLALPKKNRGKQSNLKQKSQKNDKCQKQGEKDTHYEQNGHNNARNSDEHEEGSFVLSDKIKALDVCEGLTSDDLQKTIFKVQWEKRRSGFQPKESYLSYCVIQKYEPNLIINFLEGKIHNQSK